METIFDYKPTDSELKELFGYDSKTGMMNYGFSVFPTHRDGYAEATSDTEKILDLAQLFAFRKEKEKADSYWAKIPEAHQQYLLGFDNVELPS